MYTTQNTTTARPQNTTTARPQDTTTALPQDTTTALPVDLLNGNSSDTEEQDGSTILNGLDITTVEPVGNSSFLNLEQSTLILIGGLAALVIIVLVVVVIVLIYIRYKSRSRRQVNAAPDHRGEPEAVSGDTVPLT